MSVFRVLAFFTPYVPPSLYTKLRSCHKAILIRSAMWFVISMSKKYLAPALLINIALWHERGLVLRGGDIRGKRCIIRFPSVCAYVFLFYLIFGRS
jgi:hypothetical protein